MRRILIGILTILLIVMAVLVITKGLTIGNFKILSVQQIIEGNDKLTAEISETEKLIRSNYPTELETLDSNVSSLLEAKEEYQDLADVSTKSEINKATTVETYTVEFLWTRLGRHATAEGVYLSYTPTNNSIKFTVSGDYIPILSFVSAIENDSKLGFRIENFKLIPGGNNLQATFETRNINIKTEGVNTAVQSTTTTESTPTNTPDTNTQNTNSTTETTQP
ncbi:MAG: hypothetical protein UGE22_03930 [Clostridia bacterium]|nr:hypothetical protein [Clostridia bacterium]